MAAAFSALHAEGGDNSNAFNKYMSPEGGINPMSGTVALQKDIASISAGQVSANFVLKYSGNVFKEAVKPNDETSSGVVGLGWSLGRSQIVCDCKENSFLDDDVYYLLTADGNRFQIFEETAWRKRFDVNYVASAQKKWWVEGNPFWKVERVVGSTILLGGNHHEWKYVKGWKITDAAGIVHTYGDIDETKSLTDPSSPGKSTEYDLIWLKTEDGKDDAYGVMGNTYGGKPNYYPVAWNLSREESLDGNSLVYTYDRVSEKLSGYFNNSSGKSQDWNSQIGYTKESYLTKVEASNGGRIEFYYGNKGENQFKNEYMDDDGEYEKIGNAGSDMFKEKFQRKYLDYIMTYGPDKVYLGKVSFCYKALREGTNYVKRLLSSIRFQNKGGKEIDYEEYSYFTDLNSAKPSTERTYAYPLGALYEVRGKSCGVVRYTYRTEPLGSGHVEELPLDKVFGTGYLENGTSYLVGKLNGKLKIYTRVLGRWVESVIAKDKDYDADEVSFGDAGWFMALRKDKVARIYQWNGKEWSLASSKNYGTTEFSSPLDFSDYKFEQVVAGPDYALSFTLDDEDGPGFNDGYLKLNIFWSKWGQTYSKKFGSINDNNGGGYNIIPMKNHILVQLQRYYCAGNCLDYFVYTFRDGTWHETKSVDGRDSENNIYLTGPWLLDVGEADHWYDDSRVQINGWNGSGWTRQLTYNFSNSDPLDVQSFGSDYVAARYNGRRHARVFAFDGETWNGSALHDKLFDYHISKKFYWEGKGTEDFFVTTRSYRRKWWCDTYTNTRIKLYYHKNGQNWTSYDYSWIDGFKYDKKELEVGSDWFVEKKATKRAWVWDGSKWKEEKLNSTAYLDGFSDIYSLGGNILAASKPGKTRLIYKVDNSFIEPFGTYMVDEKLILEPVADRVVKYKYSFLPRENAVNGVAFDDATNTPLMDVMKVEVPNEKGIVERQLCDLVNGVESVSVGSVCSEIQWDNQQSTKISLTKTKFERFRSNWPYPVYLDQEKSKVTIARGLKTVTQNTYSDKNGMVVKTVKKMGNRGNEEKYVFVSDLTLNSSDSKIAAEFSDKNRLDILAGSYSCVPNCASGNIISATANGYSDVNNLKTATSVWKFTPKKKVSENDLKTQMVNIALRNQQNENWERQSFNSVYSNKQVVETQEGPRNIKVASFVEDKERGKLLGTAANCGINEGLMLSGESCEMKNWSGCDITSLSGYAVDLASSNSTDYSSYGRFSKKVVKLVSGKPLEGVIPSAKNEDYVFSAWIQYKSENGTLSLSVNGSAVSTWETHPASIPADSVGQWKRIEWTGKIGSGQKIVLKAQNISTEIHLQDIRVLPVTATSTANFWNEDWDKIQTTVDSRGLGAYVNFDELGREVEHYSETSEGTVYMSSRTTFADGNCSAYPNGSDQLASLLLNGKPQKLPVGNESRYVSYLLDDFKVRIEFTPVVPNEGVVYRLYAEGQDPGDWVSPSCGALCYPSFTFTPSQKSWILEVDVIPYRDAGKYVFNLRKKESDWVEYGNYEGFAKGEFPKYRNTRDQASVVFMNRKGKIDTAKFDGNNWVVDHALSERVSEFTTYTGNSGSFISFISAEEMPADHSYLNYPKVFRVVNSGLEQYNISDKKFRADNVTLSESSRNNLVMLYNTDGRIGTVSKEINGTVQTHEGFIDDAALYAMEWNPQKRDFEYIGSLPKFTYAHGSADRKTKEVSFSTGTIESYRKGMVSDYPAVMSDAVVGPDGKMYVAYIGQSSYFTVCKPDEDDPTKTECDTEVPLVYVKRLYSASEITNVTEDVWAGPSQVNGVPLYQGDILSWSENVYDAVDGAKKIKLDYDGTNLYLAVSYMLNEADEEDENGNTVAEAPRERPSLALTVFKGSIERNRTVGGKTYSTYLKWEPMKDLSIKTTHYAKTLAEEQSRIAYLEDNDDFNFIVRNGIPYIMFRNEDNEGGLSVIKFEQNRWLSVGNPDFAYPEKSIASASLSVNYEGTPFVVFKTDNSIQNLDRENKILGMRYNRNNALDLTLTSFEASDVEFNRSCAFRQYILSYTANLSNVESFTFKAVPKTPGHVKQLEIYSGKDYLMTVTNYSQNITVPLKEGQNDIEVRVVGHDNSTLSYKFTLLRFFEEVPDLTFVGLTAKTNITYKGGDVLNPDVPKGFVIDIDPVVTTKDGKHVTLDIHVPLGWEFTLPIDGKNKTYTVSTTEDIPIDNLPLTGGYLYNTVTGEVIPVTITNTDKVEDPTVLPWYDYPTDVSSSSGTSSGSSGQSSSSSVVNQDMSTNVPVEVRNVSTATIFATSDVYLADNVSVKGDILAGHDLNIGVTTSAKNNVYSGGSVTLRNRADVASVYYVSNLEVQDGAHYTSAAQLSNMTVTPLPTYSFATGTASVLVESGVSTSLTGGSYDSFTARTGSTVSFGAGDYYFSSFYTDSDVNMNFAPGTRIWVNGNLRIGNGCRMVHSGKVGDLFVYVNGNVTVETNVEIHAVLLAPNARISFSTGLHVYGYVYSNAFSIQPNSVIE